MKINHSFNLFPMRALAAAIGLASGAAHAVDPLVTNLNDSGAGSLRQAMLDASEDGGAASIIQFGEGLSGTIALQSPLPTMTDSVDILGHGVTVQLQGASEGEAVFSFLAEDSREFKLRGLTVTGGTSGAVSANLDSDASLLLEDAVITGNVSASSVRAYRSAAVTVEGGSLQVTSSEISGNTNIFIPEESALRFGYGGGIFARDSTLVVEDSKILDNHAAIGGGINTYYSNVEIVRSVVSGNSAILDAGGINSRAGFQQRPLTISASTVSGNTASIAGGVKFYGYNGGDLTIRDSSISNNTASSYAGGVKVFIRNAYFYGEFSLENSLIEGNSATERAGGLEITIRDASIDSSIIRDNVAGIVGDIENPGAIGGINFYGRNLSINKSVISGNQAAGRAAGHLKGSGYGGFTDIDESTISGHSAAQSGVLNISPTVGGQTTIQNSTISGNTAAGPVLSVIGQRRGSYYSANNVNIFNSTISGNSSTQAPAVFQLSGAPFLRVEHSTFVDNNGTTSESYPSSAQLSLHGFTDSELSTTSQLTRSVFTSDNTAEVIVGGNPFGDEPSDTKYVGLLVNNTIMTNNVAVAAGGDVTGSARLEDPELAPLGYRGGFTLVHEPMVGSSAIDTGSESSRPDSRDQRGLTGQEGSNSDLGAVEVVGNTPPRLAGDLGARISGGAGTEVPAFSVASLFVDDDGDDVLVESVSGLPAGLTFDGTEISGSLDATGSFVVTLVATDDNARPLKVVEQFVVDVTDAEPETPRSRRSDSGSIPVEIVALFGFLALFRRRFN
jgi:hypothetical protein